MYNEIDCPKGKSMKEKGEEMLREAREGERVGEWEEAIPALQLQRFKIRTKLDKVNRRFSNSMSI